MLLKDYILSTAAKFDEADLFYGHGTSSPLDEAVYLIFSTLGIDFGLDFELSDRVLLISELEKLDARIEQRLFDRKPVAYIVGEAWFCGHAFQVDERVLIPRSPIAELISNRFQPILEFPPETILDLCCGSGCLGIACALEFLEARVDLSDVSSDCLEVAAGNIRRHDLVGRTQCVKSDLFASLTGRRYDLIVSNPPYVSLAEIQTLPAEYQHEPKLALLSEEGGLGIPLEILRRAGSYLNPGGLLFLEVGLGAEALCQRVPKMPFLWMEFAGGGDGVLAIRAEELLRYREYFI